MKFGVQTIAQGIPVGDLITTWKHLEAAGYDALSVADHLAPIRADDDEPIADGLSLHVLLAASTERVTCGALVYCAAFRPVGVLARALSVVAELSEGRCFAGLGAGWWQPDFQMWGLPFGSPGERSDILEEVAKTLAAVLRGERVDHDGQIGTLDGARCGIRSGATVPVWVAGNGPRRTLPTCAAFADGWNSPFTGPETFAKTSRTLDELCQRAGRAPSAVTRSVNVRLAWDATSEERVRAEMRPGAHEGILSGSPEQIRERVGRYAEAGVDLLMVDVRAPQHVDDLLRFHQEVVAPMRASGRHQA
jgi:alkanesulfonate monooxygenase SsuD/methylene tetrahydromethanopterin reductase-like flavin-dependent oxidoreductase (luciferase family)